MNVVEQVQREMGLDLPLIQQFYIYLKSALSGDFGHVHYTTKPVMTDIRRVFPTTIELATLGTIIGSVVGIPLGVLAAVKTLAASSENQIVRIIGLVGYSVPIFWLGLLGLVLFYAQLQWVAYPTGASISFSNTHSRPSPAFICSTRHGRGNGTCSGICLKNYHLADSLLGYFSLAYISRMTRAPSC